MFGGAICQLFWRANETQYTGCIDDRASFLHVRHLSAQTVPQTCNVYSHNEFPVVVLYLFNVGDSTLPTSYTCKIGCTIQLPELLDCVCDPAFHIGTFADVDNLDHDLCTSCSKLAFKVFQWLLLYVGEGKLGSFAGEKTDGFKAYSRRRSSNGDDFILERHDDSYIRSTLGIVYCVENVWLVGD